MAATYHSPTPWGGVDGISRELDALEKSRPDYVRAQSAAAAPAAAADSPAPADYNEMVRTMSSGSKIRHIVNFATSEAMDCEYFMARWDHYKADADKVAAGAEGAPMLTEFNAMTEDIIKEWKVRRFPAQMLRQNLSTP